MDDKDKNNLCSSYEIKKIRNKATYLAMVLYLSLKHYESVIDFNSIINMAMEKINEAHLVEFLPSKKRYKSSYIVLDCRTIFKWFRAFRDNDCFVNPGRNSGDNSKIPRLFSDNPDLFQQTTDFCRQNINSLSCEVVHQYLLDTALPKLVQSIQKDSQKDFSMDDLFRMYNLKTLNVKTIQNWMNRLGFKYEPRKKSYYVDTHETPENVAYRSKFISKYFEYELLAHRWHTISSQERDRMIKDGDIGIDTGYMYTSSDGSIRYEYHIDDHPSFQKACKDLRFGGNLSVRKPEDKKKIMMLGQDEAIMRRNLFSLFSWTLPDGAKALLPKDEGQGIMVSAFTSREIGFGFSVPPECLDEINKIRDGTHYSDRQAALLLYGTSKKQKLESSPFVRELDYGKNNEGYWTYDHMVIQLEDCIDVLKFMFPDFDFLFFLDHSNGHDRMRPNGLNLNKVSMKFAGKQPEMRSSVLTSSCFGPFHDDSYALQVGSEQKMQFSENDPGPFYLAEHERIQRRHDIDTGTTRTRDVLKADLIKALRTKIKDPCGSKEKLQEIAKAYNIPTQFEERKILEGWVGRPKGALQILYERGWIEPNKAHLYSKNGRKGPDGSNQYSIKALMEMQEDFTQELTLLQYHASLLGVTIERTPKCHPEIAGEGIEYNWALSKTEYRKSPVKEKKCKESFKKLVRKCMDNKTILSLSRVRSCSRKARDYMILYKAVESLNLNESDGIDGKTFMNKHVILEDSIKLYRQLQRTKKSHRSVLDSQLYDVRMVELENPLEKDTKEELVCCLVSKMIKI